MAAPQLDVPGSEVQPTPKTSSNLSVTNCILEKKGRIQCFFIKSGILNNIFQDSGSDTCERNFQGLCQRHDVRRSLGTSSLSNVRRASGPVIHMSSRSPNWRASTWWCCRRRHGIWTCKSFQSVWNSAISKCIRWICCTNSLQMQMVKMQHPEHKLFWKHVSVLKKIVVWSLLASLGNPGLCQLVRRSGALHLSANGINSPQNSETLAVGSRHNSWPRSTCHGFDDVRTCTRSQAQLSRSVGTPKNCFDRSGLPFLESFGSQIKRSSEKKGIIGWAKSEKLWWYPTGHAEPLRTARKSSKLKNHETTRFGSLFQSKGSGGCTLLTRQKANKAKATRAICGRIYPGKEWKLPNVVSSPASSILQVGTNMFSWIRIFRIFHLCFDQKVWHFEHNMQGRHHHCIRHGTKGLTANSVFHVSPWRLESIFLLPHLTMWHPSSMLTFGSPFIPRLLQVFPCLKMFTQLSSRRVLW